MLTNFLNEYRKSIAQARDRVYHDLKASRWDLLDPELNKQVVPEAMRLLVKQLYLARDEVVNNKPCTGNFEAIHGIPCYHTLRLMKSLNSIVRMEDFHCHWYFERPQVDDNEPLQLPDPPAPPAGPAIFAPRKVVTRGRKRKDHSTRRDPSQFEVTTGIAPLARPGRVGGETSRVRTVFSLHTNS